ncbi:MAG: LD-carboxypeptidase, partial [Desulfatirhabdiaceae bacterium]|nr:LD-carboxypeptidase [Desulfatirhabdiaceae bacterium]
LTKPMKQSTSGDMINTIDKRIPKRLKHGDCIGIVAPASPFEETDFYAGIAILENMGFRVSFPEGIFARAGYLAGSDWDRAAQLNAAFADGDVRAIVCARGGYGSMQILPYLNYEAICRHPKLVMGFSDITALLCSLYQRSGLVSCHGPVVTSLKNAGPRTLESVFNALTLNKLPEIRLENGRVLSPGKATGPVICGNLTTLCHLLGTPYEPKLNGHILILEDTGEKPYRIDRMLTQMKLAGVFNGLCGLGIGSFENCGKAAELFEIIARIFDPFHIPILAGFNIGHGPDNIAVPFGLEALLDADHHMLVYRTIAG